MLGATLLPLPRLPCRGCHHQRPTLFLRNSSVSLQPEPASTGWLGCPCLGLPACQACHQARMPYRTLLIGATTGSSHPDTPGNSVDSSTRGKTQLPERLVSWSSMLQFLSYKTICFSHCFSKMMVRWEQRGDCAATCRDQSVIRHSSVTGHPRIRQSDLLTCPPTLPTRRYSS